MHLSTRFVEPNDMRMQKMTARTHLISGRLGLSQPPAPLEEWHASKGAFFVFLKKNVSVFKNIFLEEFSMFQNRIDSLGHYFTHKHTQRTILKRGRTETILKSSILRNGQYKKK